ncbi:sodium-dependent transporter [Halothermothrix orenii]|uniref:Sodium:neurotransmitter symporter n=1 Tax=Halothermothrix orenii (strain H 168 / OCM 544 / DSM 9562) TaxID=373903 RepID=B8CZ71_HALOH|nr:sodium-dependent transporter [Halothermothrix orenii]ACL70590.1 sodium:neurotransmitter symporter [Halothermothrix orenii H 168]
MEKKEQWGSRLGFIFAAIGSAVGLGNIWRFSYQAYENGGGAFLLPYLVALFTAGIPLLILELGLGFRTRSSAPLSFKKIGKKYEWIGWWSVGVGFVITVYYTVIIGWSLAYVFKAFNLNWGSNPASHFTGEFLGATGSVWELGGIRFFALACLIIVWLANYFIISRGVQKGIEKASKIFMPLLFFLVILITIRGITLPGSIEGIKAFVTPDFSKITDWRIWVSAFGQIFFTLSLGFGIMIAYASYLPKDSDVVSNGIITALANSAFSIITGFGVFGVLGYMAMKQGVPVSEVATDGIGLAFIAFPKAINLLPAASRIFGVLFFLSLVIAGLSSSISLVEAMVAALIDKFEISRKKAVTYICIISLILGIPFVTGGGLVLLDIVDHFINRYGLLLVGFVELVVISYFFGVDKIKKAVNPSSNTEVGPTWSIMVKYLSPLALIFALFLELIKDLTSLYGNYTSLEIILFGWGTVLIVILLAFNLARREITLKTNV